MPIRYNYTHAARRLLGDAMTLWPRGRRETAAHLAGLAAECALKSVLVGLGVARADAEGQVVRRSPARAHMPLLFSEFATQLQGRSGVAYGALLPTPHAPPFHDWMVDHRYVSDAQLADETLERWMWAAIAISKLLAVAIDNGEAQ